MHERGDEPEIKSQPWLDLRGVAQEPVKGVTDVVVSLYPKNEVACRTDIDRARGSLS